MRAFTIAAVLPLASGFSLTCIGSRTTTRTSTPLLFEEPAKPFELRSALTRSSDGTLSSERQGASVLVTEGTDSFYGAAGLIQNIHDFGRHKSIAPFSESAAAARKSLISRRARYSGLLDVLDCRQGEMGTADIWLAINADEKALPAQIAAAKEAGVKRAFILISAAGPSPALEDAAATEALLVASGMKYTVMRTGNLVAPAESGTVDPTESGGLRIGEIGSAVCEDVSAEDVYRFVTEAMTLPEAEGRLFSLCPTEDTTQLKQMRLCGYERRDEVAALLRGFIAEPSEEDKAAAVEQEPELVLRSEAEVAEERAEELKELLARARARGEEAQRKMKFEEEEKARMRAEQQAYYSAPPEDGEGSSE